MCYTEQRVLFLNNGDVQEEELKVGRKPNLENWGTEPTDRALHTELNGQSFDKIYPRFKELF
jgi:hypothetical protein